MESRVRRIEMGQERSLQGYNDQVKNVVFAVSWKMYMLD